MNRSIILAVLLFASPSLFLVTSAHAQLAEALELSMRPLPSGSRGMGMGGSLISAATGVDALEANPAAIAPLAEREFTFSLFNRNHGSTADFFNTSSTASLDATSLATLGIAAPIPTTQGHLAIGISYDRSRDYTASYSFKAINPNSSYFNTNGFLQDFGNQFSGQMTNSEYLLNYNLAYALGLTYGVPDNGAYQLTTPFTNARIMAGGGIQQSGTVTESGGLKALRFGAGIDIAEGVSAGATINALFGSYDYTMNYQETDVNGIFANDTGTLPPNKFQQANVMTTLHEDQGGASLKFGLQVRRSIFDLGFTFETPEWIHVSESSTQTGTASFGTNGNFPNPYPSNLPVYTQEYDINTPLRLGVGGSVHLSGLTAAVGISYADMSELRFANGTFDMSALNDTIQADLRGVLSYKLGAEYVLPFGLALRAGYNFEPSPYKGDPTNYGTTAISGGLAFTFSKSVSLEAALVHSMYHTNHSIYDDTTPQGDAASANITDDAVTRNDVMVTFTYSY